MTDNIFKTKFTKLLAVIISAAVFVVSLPLCALAAPFEENQEYSSSDGGLSYTDEQSGEYWVVSEGLWHSCVNAIDSLDSVTDEIRQAMYNREGSKSLFFITAKNNSYGDINEIFNTINEDVYKADDAYGGDYLSFLSTIELNANSGILTASSSNDSYDFYRISVNINNVTSAHEEELVKEYLAQWNEIFINSNPVISNASSSSRDYCIVKTIYNFLAKNVSYDEAVYNQEVDLDSEQYRFSHTAYGALFGGIDGAYNSDVFDIGSASLDYTEDAQGLYRTTNKNQGLSVCDGYSLVFYYLCRLNNIDCRIIQGDNVSTASDPHAWNAVYLDGWYYIDATFASQTSMKFSDEFTIVNYNYFLKGSGNAYFSEANHQQPYDEYDSISISQSDYIFVIESVNDDKLYTIISRKREQGDGSKIVETGEYNLENYIIIDPNGNYYKLEKNESDSDYHFVQTDGFVFYATGYYYSCELTDFAINTEYTSTLNEGDFLKDSATYHFNIVNSTGSIVYNREFTIEKLDMSDWSSYDRDLTTLDEKEYFCGRDIDILAAIYDNSQTLLENGTDYDVYCYKKGCEDEGEVNPHDIGNYTIRIVYKGNYTGSIEFDFSIQKTDISTVNVAPAAIPFGIDIEKNYVFALGDQQLTNGVDYTAEVMGTVNYGDSGQIKLTALESSEYLEAGTVAYCDYTIDEQYDISSMFNGKYISSTRYAYTGKAIEPADFTIGYTKGSTGEKIYLVNGTDYVIDGYSSNVNVGTGIIKISFIGNYTGSAEMYFYIDYVNFDVTIPDLVYTGKSLSPSPVVMLGDNVLESGVDYTVTGSAVNPGVYQCKIQGLGSYSGFSGTYLYYIIPSQLTGVKITESSSVTVSFSKQGSNCIYQLWAYDSGKSTWRYIAQTTGTSLQMTWTYVNGVKTNLKANTKYNIRVRAYYKVSVNDTSVEKFGSVTNYTVRTAPAKISGLKTASAATYINISWTAQSGCAYQVYAYDTTKKKWTYIGRSTTNTFKLTYIYTNGKKVNISADREYKIYVRAYFNSYVNGAGTPVYGSLCSKATRSAPKTPTLTLSKSGTTAVKATWSRNTSVNGYQVYLSPASNFSSGVKKALFSTNKTTTTTFKGLKKGKTYYVRVRSYKKVGGVTYYSAYKTAKIKL